jgi:hypothetical protein
VGLFYVAFVVCVWPHTATVVHLWATIRGIWFPVTSSLANRRTTCLRPSCLCLCLALNFFAFANRFPLKKLESIGAIVHFAAFVSAAWHVLDFVSPVSDFSQNPTVAVHRSLP